MDRSAVGCWQMQRTRKTGRQVGGSQLASEWAGRGRQIAVGRCKGIGRQVDRSAVVSGPR